MKHADDAQARLAVAKAELQSYHDAWGQVETLTRGFPIDGWVGLVEVVVEMVMSLEQEH